jgi:beta-phosphoglucomutase-like phosphatase (HAD superfamily)
MISAVIFDFDGVLADTERLHLAAFRDVFDTRGWALDDDTYFDRYMGYDDKGLFKAYAADRGVALDEDELVAMVGTKGVAFRRHLGSGHVLYPGAADCLTRLDGRFLLGVASGALRAEIIDILSAGGVLSRFRTIVGADDVSAMKPAPEPYLEAAARLGVEPRHCVAVEDSRWGLESATRAGMRTIAITNTSNPSTLTMAHRAIAHLDELTIEAIDALAPR